MAGLGGQKMINSMEDLASFVMEHNGKKSLYISHNSYPGHEKDQIINVERVMMKCIFFDIDSKKLENALADARSLVKWFDSNQLPFTVAFSGKKGFQILLQLEPGVYSLTDKMDGKYTLSSFYKATYNYLRSTLKLRSLDIKCAEPKRICRIWNTSHHNNKTDIFSGTYCVPLTKTQLFNWNVNDILDYAAHPRPIPKDDWNLGRRRIKFHEFIDEFEIDPDYTHIEFDPEGSMISSVENADSMGFRWLHALFPHTCVANALHNYENPPHIIRIAMATWLRKLAGMAPTIEKNGKPFRIAPTPDFVDQFYRVKKYRDWENHPERMVQILSIWNRVPEYNMPSCRTLYENALCVGPKCSLYGRFLSRLVQVETPKEKGGQTEGMD